MRALRSVGLLASVAAAYFAQYIFLHGSLETFFPVWLLDRYPTLYGFARWQTTDLNRLALWLAILAALVFGLLSAFWRGEQTPRAAKATLTSAPAHADIRQRQAAWVALGVAVVATAGAVATRNLAGVGAWLPLGCWLIAVVAYVAAGWFFYPPVDPAGRAIEQPFAGWPYLVVLVVLGLLLYGYQLYTLPPRIDALSAQAGLGAAQIRQEGIAGLMQLGALGVPQAAYLGVALWTWLTADPVAGVRLAGFAGGVLLIIATWLTGNELYRRRIRVGTYGETVEDDGRLMAFLAALVTTAGILGLHYSRLPLLMEAAAWGTLGIWALLHSLRRGALWLTAASGLLVGLACFFSSLGLVFVLTAVLTWLGITLLKPVWLEPAFGGGKSLLGAALYWLGAVALLLGPLAAVVLRDGQVAHAYWLAPFAAPPATGGDHTAMLALAAGGSDLTQNMRTLLGAFAVGGTPGLVPGISTSLLHALLAPLFVLALGALAVNLDTAVGWILAFWIGSAWVVAVSGASGAPNAPALLAGWPAVGLILAFGMDRLRVTLLESFGTWMMQAAIYLILGVVVGAGVLTWVSFTQAARLDGDAISYVVRVLAATQDDDAPIIVVNSGTGLLQPGDPVAEFWMGQPMQGRTLTESALTELPAQLTPGTRLLLIPAEGFLLPELQRRYPSGRLDIQRDLRGDPVLYIYSLANNSLTR